MGRQNDAHDDNRILHNMWDEEWACKQSIYKPNYNSLHTSLASLLVNIVIINSERVVFCFILLGQNYFIFINSRNVKRESSNRSSILFALQIVCANLSIIFKYVGCLYAVICRTLTRHRVAVRIDVSRAS